MGSVPEIPKGFPIPEGVEFLPVRVAAYPDKLAFHMAATDTERGVLVEAHTDEATRLPVGFTIHFHELLPGALVETLEVALQAARELEGRYEIHQAQRHAGEN